MVRPWFVAALVLAGCSDDEFVVAPAGDSAVTTQDTNTASTDSAIVVDDSAIPEVIESEACPPNACGGCMTLSPAPKTACGICETSEYICATPNSTKCAVSDDRVNGSEVYFKGVDGRGLTLSGAGTAVAISFTMLRDGSPTSLTLALQRYDVNPGAAVGNLRVRLIKGTPTTTVDAGAVLGTSLIAATTIPDTPMTTFVLLPSGGALLTKGTPLWVEITDASELSNFAVNGASATGPAGLDFHYLSGSVYVREGTIDPYLVVGLKACF